MKPDVGTRKMTIVGMTVTGLLAAHQPWAALAVACLYVAANTILHLAARGGVDESDE